MHSLFFQQKISEYCVLNPLKVNEMTLNELVKLTTLWTTVPRCWSLLSVYAVWNWRKTDMRKLVTITRKSYNHEAQPFQGSKRRRDEEHIRTTQTPQTHKQRTTTKETKRKQRKNRLGTDSVTAPNYKYRFGLHRSSLHLICKTSQWNIYIKSIAMKQSKGLNSYLKPEHEKTKTGPRWSLPQTLRVRYGPSETDWAGIRHLVWGPSTHRRAIKAGSKVVNHNWVNNSACSVPHNIYVVHATYLFVASLFKLHKKLVLLTTFLTYRLVKFWKTFLQKRFQTNVTFGYLFRMTATQFGKCFT